MRLFDLTGRTAVVTGAGRGMGFGIAQALARQGANVVVNDYFADRAEDAVAKLLLAKLHATAAVGDLTQPQTPATIVAAAERRFGPVDILVNNAGVLAEGMPLKKFEDLTDQDIDANIALNYRATMAMTRAVLAGMRARQWGRIVNISSESWRIGLDMGLIAYASAKAAAVSFTRHLAVETGHDGVTANVLSLGTMNNWGYDTIALRTTAIGRAGTPDDVGAAVAYLVSNEASWMTGQVIALNGGSLTA